MRSAVRLSWTSFKKNSGSYAGIQALLVNLLLFLGSAVHALNADPNFPEADWHRADLTYAIDSQRVVRPCIGASGDEPWSCFATIRRVELELPIVRWSGLENDPCELTTNWVNEPGGRLALVTRGFPLLLPEDITFWATVPQGELWLTTSIKMTADSQTDREDPRVSAELNEDLFDQWVVQRDAILARQHRAYWRRDDLGCSDGEAPEEEEGPSAVFTWEITMGTTVNFNAGGSSGGASDVSLFTWDFGDETAITDVTLPTLEHIYAEPGLYSVTLRVRNTNGDEDSVTHVVRVTTTEVNSLLDRGRAANTVGCDTGQVIEDDIPECTLRAAVEMANAGEATTVGFAIPVTGIPRIELDSVLPVITVPLSIDGTTQEAGRVEIVGPEGDGPGGIGFHLQGGMSVISGLVLSNFHTAIRISDGDGNQVIGTSIGLDTSGNSAAGDPTIFGIEIVDSSGNVVGGEGAEANRIGLGGIGVGIDNGNNNTVIGNYIGLFANGTQALQYAGVAMGSGDNNRISGNRIVTYGFGITAASDRAISNGVVENNHIGLEEDGLTSPGALACIMAGSIENFGGGLISGLQIRGNQVAGCFENIHVFGESVIDTVVADNQVGLAFNDSGQLPNLGDQQGRVGIRVDGSAGTVIEDNVVVGHRYDLLIAGGEQVRASSIPFDFNNVALDSVSGDLVFANAALDLDYPFDSPAPSTVQADNLIIRNNTIGVTENGLKPAGADSSQGIIVFSNPADVTLEGNVVAGHNIQGVLLQSGASLTLASNYLGASPVSNLDVGSQKGLTVVNEVGTVTIGGELASRNVFGFNAEYGIELVGSSGDISVRNNHIGVDDSGRIAWPNGTGVFLFGGSLLPDARIAIQNNRVSGNTDTGLFLTGIDDTNQVVVQGNNVGTAEGGLMMPNDIGIFVGDNARLQSNTVAFNSTRGIRVSSGGRAEITGGAIYNNGDDRGIFYDDLVEAPDFPVVLRGDVDEAGNIAFLLISPENPGATVQYELWGNPDCSNPEGRVALLQGNWLAERPIVRFVTTDESEPFATMDGFTLTTTMDETTTPFSTCVPAEAIEDEDNDGASNFVESLFGPDDIDENDQPDSEQGNIVTFVGDEDLDGVTEETVADVPRFTLVGPQDVLFQEVDKEEVPGFPLEMPYGLLSFEVFNVQPAGAQIPIGVVLGEAPLESHGYIKLADPNFPDGYVQMPEEGPGDHAERTATGWVLHITDGGEFDFDGAADGHITDPGGPAVMPTEPPEAEPRASSSDDSRCFVATAAFGEHAAETEALRVFRDRHLMTHETGREFVAWYYLNSPSWVDWAEGKSTVSGVARLVLQPVAYIAGSTVGMPVDFPRIGFGIALLFMLLLLLAPMIKLKFAT